MLDDERWMWEVELGKFLSFSKCCKNTIRYSPRSVGCKLAILKYRLGTSYEVLLLCPTMLTLEASYLLLLCTLSQIIVFDLLHSNVGHGHLSAEACFFFG
jgi:hypothetical protein